MRRKFGSFCVLAILYCLMTTTLSWAEPINYSNWTKNLSGVTDTLTGYYNYENAKIAVSGQYVHVVWLASGYGDIAGNTLFYRGSSDGGQTFGAAQALVPNVSGNIFSATNMMLAADGNYVHIVYKAPSVSGGECLKLIRSIDNGQTFETHKIVYTTDRYPLINGVYLSASNGKVAIGLSANDDNSPYPKDLACVYSGDNGATFGTTAVAHSTSIWRYTAVDTILSGSNVYILYIVTDANDSATQSHLYLVSSNDGGATFNPPNKVNLADVTGNFYTTNVNGGNGGNYSPHLAAVGSNVYVTFVNYYDANTYTLRVTRLTDGGKTLGGSVVLGDPGTVDAFPAGPQAIAAAGSNVYVTSMNNGSTMFWRSTDSGASFGATPVKISDGGITPLISIDPSVADGSRIYVANSNLSKSTDWGASFNGIINPKPATLMFNWMYSSLVVDGSGIVHYVGQSAYVNSDPYDIFYRRLEPSAAPGPTPKALNLVTDSSKRKDNMQVAASPDINLTSAMTIEFWARIDTMGDWNNWYHFGDMVSKKRASGNGSIVLGYTNWAGGFYGRLITENGTNSPSDNTLSAGFLPVDLAWNHIAMTYDATAGANNWKYYVNGELANSTTLTGNIVMDYMPLVLGPDTSPYGGGLQLSDFRVWNRARGAAEILADMNRTLAGSEPWLVAYYTFNDSTKDMTGRGNDGVLMYKESFIPSTVPPFVPLATAINNDTWTMTTGDIHYWKGQTTVNHDGVSAAQSGKIGHKQNTWLQTDVNGPGQLSFWWKVSSEATGDFLRFKIDGVEPVTVPGISGEIDWASVTVDIPSGNHTIQWVYSKDNSVASGSDAGWVDQVVFTKQQQLNLIFSGNGAGQVNGAMSCVSSGPTCNPVLFADGSKQILTATPDVNSTFVSWSGCTSVSSTNCNVTMNSPKTVTVTFDPGPPVKILGGAAAGFATLRLAYEAAVLPPATSTIQIRSITLPDPPITFDRPVSVFIKGGYDALFDPANNGVSTILGPVTIKDGKVTIEKVAVK